VDPHDEDVEESLDSKNQDFEDGDVNEQAIEEIQEESKIQKDSEIREDSDVTFSQEDSGGGSQRLVQPPSTVNQLSTPVESGRTQRTRKQPSRLIPSFTGTKYEETGHNMVGAMKPLDGMTVEESIKYLTDELMDDGAYKINPEVFGLVMVQLSMKSGAAKLGELPVAAAAEAEMKQIHMRSTFVPQHWKNLTAKQRDQILEAFLFVEKKKSGQVKGRLVVNGKMQRGHISKDIASSPTAHSESIMLTGVIDAMEGRDVATGDIPNAFVGVVVTDEDKDQRVLVRLRGRVVDILVCKIAPEVYKRYVTVNRKVRRH
jgi:hypothetical protein